MIDLSAPARQISNRYFRDNVDGRELLTKALCEFIEGGNRRIISSRPISGSDDLERGSYSNTLITDLVYSLKTADVTAASFVLDTWMKPEDAEFKTSVDVERRFLPSVVYSLGPVGDHDLSARVVRVLQNCGSFVVVAFALPSPSWTDFRSGKAKNISVSAVVITAFDQEGCIAWV